MKTMLYNRKKKKKNYDSLQEQLKTALKALEEKLKVLKTEKVKWTCDQTASHVKVRISPTPGRGHQLQSLHCIS